MLILIIFTKAEYCIQKSVSYILKYVMSKLECRLPKKRLSSTDIILHTLYYTLDKSAHDGAVYLYERLHEKSPTYLHFCSGADDVSSYTRGGTLYIIIIIYIIII